MTSSNSLRSDRMIAIGRTVLAGSALFALWLDPSEPANLAPIAYALLAAYFVWASALSVPVLVSDRVPGPRAALAIHALELVLYSAFVYFTSGPSSPFTAFFVFSLACGTLRWGWRGALSTGAVALLAFLAVGAYFATVLDDPGFQLSSFVIRGFYLGVIASLFASLGAHEEQLRKEASELARRGASAEERNRLARDLHDGVLQSFTGFALRLAAIRRQLGRSPSAETAADLEELQRLIRLDQRDLRFFIRELQPRPDEISGAAPSLDSRLRDLEDRIERTWDVDVSVALRTGTAPDPRHRDAYLLVREAVLNSVRHGDPDEVRVVLEGGTEETLRIDVLDDGSGFPFAGRLDHEQLRAAGVGPRSLLQRVEAIGGSVMVESSERGARIHLEIPTPGDPAGEDGGAESAVGRRRGP